MIWIIPVVIVLIIFWLISIYNSLVRLRNTRQNAFADIDVQLKQRHDLVPQLVESVKGLCYPRARIADKNYPSQDRSHGGHYH